METEQWPIKVILGVSGFLIGAADLTLGSQAVSPGVLMFVGGLFALNGWAERGQERRGEKQRQPCKSEPLVGLGGGDESPANRAQERERDFVGTSSNEAPVSGQTTPKDTPLISIRPRLMKLAERAQAALKDRNKAPSQHKAARDVLDMIQSSKVMRNPSSPETTGSKPASPSGTAQS